ncbi:MAG: multidrug efflux pump subunit AcrA (membrane-fusion protein) [Candidatus Azotimanducaceae bacterium]|jgi:multidrug efflux pump subunit AcrA (membrane-fusion protein)
MSLIETQRNTQEHLKAFRELRYFDGVPGTFWPKLLDMLGNYTLCEQVVILSKPDEEIGWRPMAVWPRGVMKLDPKAAPMQPTLAVAEQCLVEEIVVESDEAGNMALLLGYYLDLGEDQPPVSLVFGYQQMPGGDIQELVEKLRLLADIPTFYQFSRLLKQARTDVVQFADAIDLMTVLNECDRFMSAAMTFCNELASRHDCDRVSLGWLEGAYVRVLAISHMEKFEKKMDAVQRLEAAMEEAFDQDEEIVWPAPDESTYVGRDHDAYGLEQGPGNLVSLPIRLDRENIGVVTIERQNSAFSLDEIRGVRLLVDQSSRHLYQLKRYDRWIGARFKSWMKDKLVGLVGVDNTFAKAMGFVGALLLAFLLFGSLEYRVEAPFILRTDEVAFIPAPIDGYVRDVNVEIGDRVTKGDVLLNLDTRELVLSEAMALADISRYSREMEKARAQNQLADMRIAQALMAQAESQLARERYHIDNARLVAPFDGIVVEGDLKEMLGAPVRKGDILFKVADISSMYVEIDLPERDVHEVSLQAIGQITFVSRPADTFDVLISEIDPAAVTKADGNVFVLKGELAAEIAPWWRPGMSGIAKVNVGDRNVLWILTHRTMDFFRMLLWW